MAPLVGASRLRAFLLPERGVLLPRPYATVAAAGVVLGVVLGFTEPVQRVEWNLYDLYARRLARNRDPAPGIVVVAIDEPSFTEVGLPWPWPRSLHGTLIDALAAGGAKTIAFDILFDVPAASPDDDAALAEAMRRAGNVVLASDQAVIDDRSYSLTQWSDPIPALSAAAAGVGVVRIPYDRDGVLRRAVLTIEGRPSLAVAVASREPGFQQPPRPELSRLFQFNGEPRRGVVTVSYYQALDARQSLPGDIFTDKHVLVGRSLAATTIDEHADHFETPVAVRMAGVEVHATILDALKRGRFIADPFHHWGLLLALGVAAGAIVSAALYKLGPIAAPSIAGGAIAMLLGIGYIALARGVRLPVVAPSVAIAGAYALTAAYRFGLVTSERRLIKRAFQNYVAPAIVEQMLNDPSRLKLGGEEYEVTVLFSDLEGFTTLSEHLAPAQLSAHLGGYFKEMLDLLLAERGTLDKLIGDAIMMYFGCPIPDPRHPIEACRGALAMQRRMVALNAQWGQQGLPRLRTRVGINTGRAVAGNMGTDTIFNYTILGDCVNLASRLEGVNKEYGTLIIAGDETWQRVRDAFEGRELDWIRVKGKVQPIAIHEVAAEAGALKTGRRDVFDRYAEALTLYREGRWAAATAAFQRVLTLDPEDGPSLTMMSRCAYYLEHQPESWDGVHVMKTK
ncbi:MAG: adenylate/guanylate cyclase domain-containing protein [Acidobacteria bacterium]|nr:adenylate/guanylate cyclase domain-containing protein [Acidobacteriota bacterium]